MLQSFSQVTLAHYVGAGTPGFGNITVMHILRSYHYILFPRLCQTHLDIFKHTDPSLLVAFVTQNGLTVS